MNFEFKATDTQKHSAAHILAAAVNRIYPNVRIGVGPVTKTGFYYEFELDEELTPQDIEKIEENIKNIISEDLKFSQIILSHEKGVELVLQQGQLFKLEILKTINDDTVSFYKLGNEFIDLCRGPHVQSTGEIPIIKITNVTKCHWNNDTKKPLLTKIEGVVFVSESEFHEFCKFQGQNNLSNLYDQLIKNSLIYKDKNKVTSLLERGTFIISKISEFSKKLFEGYHLTKFYTLNNLYSQDHLSNYLISNTLSYKTLPCVFYETAQNKFSQSSLDFKAETEIFTFISSRHDALINVGNLFENIVSKLDKLCLNASNVEIRCSNLDDLFVISLSNLLQKRIISHTKILSFNSTKSIEISLSARDAHGGIFNIANMELQSQSDKFFYASNENKLEPASTLVVKINQEGIFSFLLSQFGMDLPFDFHPNQIMIIPLSKDNFSFSKEVLNALQSIGLNCHIDLSSKSIKYKIRRAEINFTKFILIIGPKEESNNSVSVRQKSKEVGLISLDKLTQFIIDNRV